MLTLTQTPTERLQIETGNQAGLIEIVKQLDFQVINTVKWKFKYLSKLVKALFAVYKH